MTDGSKTATDGSGRAPAIIRDPATGRIVRRANGLTVRQSAFVAAYVSLGGDVALASRAAGYSSVTAAQAALRSAPVQAAIRESRFALLEGNACRAVGVLREVMDDRGAPAAARVQAARLSLALVGHTDSAPSASPGAPGAPGGAPVPLESMPLDDLEAFVAAGMAAVRRLRPVIDVTPADASPRPAGSP